MTSPTYGRPLRDVLCADSLTGSVVLAGRAGLGHAVAGLNVMEVPDIQAYVKPDELLLTTGFPLASLTPAAGAERERAMVALIRDLHASGLAGLAVKLGRYLDEIPRRALDVAEELGFPVVRLRDDVAFDDIFKEVYASLSTLQAGVLEQIDALHAALTAVVLEGGDLAQIAAEVARVLDVRVLITSTDGGSGQPPSTRAPGTGWSLPGSSTRADASGSSGLGWRRFAWTAASCVCSP